MQAMQEKGMNALQRDLFQNHKSTDLKVRRIHLYSLTDSQSLGQKPNKEMLQGKKNRPNVFPISFLCLWHHSPLKGCRPTGDVLLSKGVTLSQVLLSIPSLECSDVLWYGHWAHFPPHRSIHKHRMLNTFSTSSPEISQSLLSRFNTRLLYHHKPYTPLEYARNKHILTCVTSYGIYTVKHYICARKKTISWRLFSEKIIWKYWSCHPILTFYTCCTQIVLYYSCLSHSRRQNCHQDNIGINLQNFELASPRSKSTWTELALVTWNNVFFSIQFIQK